MAQEGTSLSREPTDARPALGITHFCLPRMGQTCMRCSFLGILQTRDFFLKTFQIFCARDLCFCHAPSPLRIPYQKV